MVDSEANSLFQGDPLRRYDSVSDDNGNNKINNDNNISNKAPSL